MDDFGLEEPVDRLSQGVVPPLALAKAPKLSPTLPTEGSTPASVSRSVYLIETYWTPRSLW